MIDAGYPIFLFLCLWWICDVLFGCYTFSVVVNEVDVLSEETTKPQDSAEAPEKKSSATKQPKNKKVRKQGQSKP